MALPWASNWNIPPSLPPLDTGSTETRLVPNQKDSIQKKGQKSEQESNGKRWTQSTEDVGMNGGKDGGIPKRTGRPWELKRHDGSTDGEGA